MASHQFGHDGPALLLGRYQVQGVQSEDDLSAAVTAFDPQANATITIETLRLALIGDPAARSALDERLARQLEAGARIGNHPHLVGIYDLVRDGAAIPFLIREFLPGGTLAERMNYGPLPLLDALHITADSARGLQAAHNVGLVHRDLTPAHIFFSAEGRAKVGGFGSAQIDDLVGETMTDSGVPAISRYLSPEQMQTSGYVPPASDQYSLGVILYEMVTGAAYDRQHPNDVAARLAALPTPVAALIARMTALQPEGRYPAMRDVVAATEAVEGSLAPAPPPGAPAEVPQYWAPPPPVYAPPPAAPPKRAGRRAVLAGVGGLVLIGAAGGGAFLFLRDRNDSAGGGATPVAATGATPTVAATVGAIPTAAATATPAPTATRLPTVAPTPTLATTPLPTLSAKAITADMKDPNQWNVITVEQSSRTLANEIYTVRVMKKPDGKGLLSWGDWIPKDVKLTPQFTAECEIRLTGDPKGSCGGILFLFNYVSNTDQQQFLTYMVRGDGAFSLYQQRPGAEGYIPRLDWTPSQRIKTGADAANTLHVSVRGGSLVCGVNGFQLAQLPVPAELATFSAFALAARVLTESSQPEASAIFRTLRYEPITA